jgi:fucose permease
VVFALTRHLWRTVQGPQPRSSSQPGSGWKAALRLPAAVWSGVSVFALQTGVESGTALWAYLFLTEARAVPSGIAAAAVSGYWIALLLGRVVLGPVATRTGPRPVLVACLAGMSVGAMLLLLPGFASAGGIVLLGLCAAPMFPLLTLTTAERVGAGWTDRAIGLQSAASAAGSATLPALIGLLIGAFGSQVIAPSLLAFVLINTAVLAWTTVRSRHNPRTPE